MKAYGEDSIAAVYGCQYVIALLALLALWIEAYCVVTMLTLWGCGASIHGDDLLLG